MLKTSIAPLSLLALAAGCAAYVPAAPLGLRASPWSRSKVREKPRVCRGGSRIPRLCRDVQSVQSVPRACARLSPCRLPVVLQARRRCGDAVSSR